MLRTDRTQATLMQCCLPRLHGHKELQQHRGLTCRTRNSFVVLHYAHEWELLLRQLLERGVLSYCRPSSGGQSTAVPSTAAPVLPFWVSYGHRHPRHVYRPSSDGTQPQLPRTTAPSWPPYRRGSNQAVNMRTASGRKLSAEYGKQLKPVPSGYLVW